MIGIAFCTAAAEAASPATSWMTVTQVGQAIKAQPLTLMTCPPGTSCAFAPLTGYISGYVNVPVHVLSVTARGMGATKRIAGASTYQTFDVRVCAIDYQQGGAKVSAHMTWKTGRPATAADAAQQKKQAWAFQKLSALIASGASPSKIAAERKALAPYLKNVGKTTGELGVPPVAEDWTVHGLGPLMHEGC